MLKYYSIVQAGKLQIQATLTACQQPLVVDLAIVRLLIRSCYKL